MQFCNNQFFLEPRLEYIFLRQNKGMPQFDQVVMC